MKSYKHGKRVLGMALALAMVFAMSVISLADNVSAVGTPSPPKRLLPLPIRTTSLIISKT